MLYTPLLERALRVSARAHGRQTRKGGDMPYFMHPAAVAMILARAGFREETTLAAALLHDVVEDTSFDARQVAATFPPPVPELVLAATERKFNADGSKRPWRERKGEHIAHVAASGVEARAIVLADKLHNLTTIVYDLQAGEPVWERFSADRDEVLWYHRTMTGEIRHGDPRLAQLADQCLVLIDTLAAL